MRIAFGIDPGLASCGFAALDDQEQLVAIAVLKTTRDKTRLGDTQARLGEMLAWVQRRMAPPRWDPYTNVAAIEWPVVGGRSNRGGQADRALSGAMTFAAAGALVGMLRSQVHALWSPVPSSWRAAVAGGRVPTEQLHADLDERFGITARVGKTKAPHALDAVGLALYARQQQQASTTTTTTTKKKPRK
jgi:Holliday junction resolvasome RuvABC endonuclease subunit